MEKIIDELGLYLSLSMLRHKIIAGNIANAETPHYKPFDLIFKDIFRNSDTRSVVDLSITDKRHIKPVSFSSSSPRFVIVPPLTISQDGNWVDIEYQMAQLAQNTMEYEIAAQLLAKKFEQIKLAINEGR